MRVRFLDNATRLVFSLGRAGETSYPVSSVQITRKRVVAHLDNGWRVSTPSNIVPAG